MRFSKSNSTNDVAGAMAFRCLGLVGSSLRPFRDRPPLWHVGQVANLPESRQIGNLPHIGACRVVVTPCRTTTQKADGLFTGVSATNLHACGRWLIADSRPFTGVSAVGGNRPGVYAGLTADRDLRLSGPFTGLLLVAGGIERCGSPGRSPVNGAGQETLNRAALAPGVNAGPNTACGGKGRKRPCEQHTARRVDAADKRQSQISNLKSQIPHPSSRIPNLKSQIPHPSSRIPNLKSQIPHPSSRISNLKSSIPHRHGGFTLIEMLIVIGIMLILVTMAATIMPSATESRRIREAARVGNIYLGSAHPRNGNRPPLRRHLPTLRRHVLCYERRPVRGSGML